MCALPLSKVLPQRKSNSLDAERENFERAQSISISKAINCQESPVKEKHVRSAIIGTFTEKGAGTFWGVVMKLPLQGNPIVCWKFCHVLHKVIREGHHNAILDSQKYQTCLKDLGKLWGLLKDGYGRLIQCYCVLLLSKLEFHRKNPRFPGNLTVTDEQLDDIGERDVNVFFQLSCEFFDYMDEILALQSAVFGSLDMSRSNSMTNCGQCRLAPLIPCIQDSSQLYDYTVKVLFKLHAALPPDTLTGHRERFLQQFKKLQQFYLSASNLQYFKHLIHVPLLPDKPPNFLIASDLSAHVSPVVILPPHTDTPENETVDMNLVDTTVPKACPSPDVLEGVFNRNVDHHQRNGSSSPDQISDKDILIERLQRELELLKMDIQRMRIEYERKIDDFKRQMIGLEAQLTEQDQIIQKLKEENENLMKSATEENATEEIVSKLTETEKKAKSQEEKFLKMKEVYAKLREEHIALIRGKADSDKQNAALKTSLEASEVEKKSLNQRIEELVSKKHLEAEKLQKSESYEMELNALCQEKITLQKTNSELNEELTTLKTQYSMLKEELDNKTANIHELDFKLKEASNQCSSLEEQNRLESNKKFSYLDSVFKEAEHIVQVVVDDLDSPALSVNNCPPEIFLQQLSNITAMTEKFENSYLKLNENPEDIKDVLQSTMSFVHLLTNVLTEGKATSNASPNIEQGDQLSQACKQLGFSGLDLFKVLQSKASQDDIKKVFNSVSMEISNTIKIMEILVPSMSQDQSQKLGDIIEQELKQMDSDIEEAARRIQEMLNNSKAGDSGMKLEVNSKILDSCTNLMQAIKVLVHASKHLQEEIVSQGKGTASIKEFYNRNHRWTEGLISAAKVVGLGARFLVNAADKVVSKQTKFEELVVASQQIAAATAQLVIASRVKAERGSEKLGKVSQASKRVTEATGQVVATAKSCAEMVEESEEMDFSKLTLHQAKRLEVESQVRVLELESMLVKERVKLAGLRKKHYQLAGASEGWEEADFAP
ncbi:huntingtin-interacting protein 1 [Trichonephila inaurata madagascariensis]|uniref:Huntingtin-interacting protein 1 n=1 Tax=Trichonephila inaurata madagascariensis TaxID=2747483 RepID=A0A8X6YAV7_9ARAC|nr:huntingtin-interacting protein 1 [Trichonephila inaurata madagascariensis]